MTTRSHELGARLCAAREDARMSKRELAAAVGVNVSQIIRLERGSFSSPNIELLSRIANTLHLSLASVLDQAGFPMHRDLPHLVPYLRERYPELPEAAVIEMERYFDRIAREYDGAGPAEKEDET
nr:helix-turn-helix domain-containing protein [Geodermatophilus sp. DF01_2]